MSTLLGIGLLLLCSAALAATLLAAVLFVYILVPAALACGFAWILVDEVFLAKRPKRAKL